MILTALIMGVAIAGIIATFWDDLVSFIKNSIMVLKRAVYATKVFVKKFREAVQEIALHYTKVEGRWEETIITRIISEDELPEDIRRRVNANYGKKVDITDELELELAN